MAGMMDADRRWAMEQNAYQREIDLAEELGYDDLADNLRALREVEYIRIFGD